MKALCCLLLLGSWSVVLASCPYDRYSKNHSYCRKPNKDCNIISSTPVTEDEKKEILRVHNELRSKVATGKTRGDYGELPKAADMLEMVWDDELAEIARRWTTQCVYDHDCQACHRTRHSKVGQNGHQFGGKNWTFIINNWYNEIKYVHPITIDNYGAVITRDVSHFTQVAWAISWRVGCGSTTYSKNGAKYALSFCNYGPWGNYQMEPVYKKGEICSKCPKNTCCGDNCKKASYPGLCQVEEGKKPVYDHPEGTKFYYYCDFSDMATCNITNMSKTKPWTVYDSYHSNYIGIVLEKGEESSFQIGTVVTTTDEACITVRYRKGPNVADDESGNEGELLYGRDLDHEPTNRVVLENDLTDFMPRMLQYGDARTFAFTLRYKALRGTQYLEIKEISVKDGRCFPYGTYP